MVLRHPLKRNLESHGIRNLGNTCFFNASMQCILSLPKLVRYILDTEFDPKKQPFCVAFQKFIFEYKNEKIVDPSSLISSIRKKIPLFDGKQQDAHAFLSSFLSKLMEECDIHKDKQENGIKACIGIDTEDCIRCKKCGVASTNKYVSIMQYLFMSNSIAESLEDYLSNQEVMDESTPWKCSNCNSYSNCSITHSIRDASDYFIVYLNRFQSNLTKNHAHINVDESITINEKKYELVAALCHSGLIGGGHYFSFCKREKWEEYNDSTVRSVNNIDVGKSAYMLFYNSSSK